MDTSLDAKKHVIIPILDELRPYNPTIGSYGKSVLNSDFEYSVKLSNGRIKIPEELVFDFERSPNSITEDRYKNIAKNFQRADTSALSTEPKLSLKRNSIAKKSNGLSWFKKSILVLGVLAGIIAIGYLYDQVQRNSEVNSQNDIKTSVRNNITSFVTAERSEYSYSNLGGISGLQITVTNSCDYLINLVRVKVDYIKASGGIWKTEYLDFNLIGPHEKSTLNAPNSDRGVRVSYEIVSINSTDLGL